VETGLTNDTIAEFSRSARQSGSEVHFAGNREHLADVLTEMLAGQEAVFCPSVTDLERSINGWEFRRTMDYQTASVVAEEVLAGVAESGTIVVSEGRNKPVRASMLCEHYVAILNHENIVPAFEDLFVSFEQLPANLCLITGPSRTADIEKTLIMGMHGPSKVSIVIV
jgi:L-lactate utilization protein LutC